MKTNRIVLLGAALLTGVALVLAVSLVFTSSGQAAGTSAGRLLPAQGRALPAVVAETDGEAASPAARASHRLIVELTSPSLAEWSAANGISRLANDRLDLNSAEAQAYLAQLEAEQAAFITEMGKALPQATVATYINEGGSQIEATYQIVFNGMTVDPGGIDRDAARRTLVKLPGVKAVHLDYAREPALYASLPLINAAAAWNNPAIGGQANAGAGIKVASMDGGLHHAAPMFDGTGYSYPGGYPLGDPANNNGKIIVSRAYFRPFDPPAPGDENTWPGENGTSHGTHTGSTAAGNPVVADYLGITETISGVAPNAYVMSYRLFYGSVQNDGSFHDAEGVAALEDIVADGADVLNNSWGGGPGSVGGEFDAIDTALINAANAGVFVSMSAGNAGPGNGTTDHPSDEYIVVAASTTSGTLAAGRLNIIEPTPISPSLQGLSYAQAAFGPPLPVGTVITYPYVAAANVDPANFEGCDAWPSGTFDNVAAVISRGACEFGVKVLNAEQAGAEFVVVHNHASGGDGLVNMGAGAVGNQVTIPSIFIGNTDGLGVVAWHTAHGSASVLEINTLAFQAGNDPDHIINFSSRGPGVGNVLKPDIAAPGVNILAQGYTPNATGEARHLGYGQASGTSMAAPHVAGAAALLRQIHPGWSNDEIKSALMSTSKYLGVFNQDGTPAQPLDMGAGRLDLTHAADPGVILDPPSLSFGAVPTGTSGVLTVTLTSVTSTAQTYDISTWLITGSNFVVTPTSPLPGFSVNTSSVALPAFGSEVITITFDSAAGLGIGDNQGYVVLESADYEAHMPAWARVMAPPAAADVLIIDNDFSFLLGFPDYRSYYTEALDALGMTYDIWHADANFANPTTIPDAATLSAYKVVIYYTGDNFYPDGTFTVATPLTDLDMDRLTEYANNGGILIAMGQDMASVLNSLSSSTASFFYESVLGGEYLQDSVSGFSLPTLPIGPMPDAPAAMQGVLLDLSGPETYLGATTLSPDNLVVFDTWLPLARQNSPPDGPASGTMPGSTSDTTGDGSFSHDVASNRLDYSVQISVTQDVTVTAVHIHAGAVDENGPVLYTLHTGPTLVTDTMMIDGSLLVDPADVGAIIAGDTYVQVHSAGSSLPLAMETRGQILVSPANDGANNQFYIDELAPDPNSTEQDDPAYLYPYAALLKYPGPYNLEQGAVAIAHRDQPSLERPGISYYGRSIYTSFGLEGVNDSPGFTSRAELIDAFLMWAMDEPTVTISDVTGTYSNTTLYTVLEASVTSPVSGTTGVLYRWDFGDGSPIAGPYTYDSASHEYAACGTYTVWVEVVDSWGNKAVAYTDINVTQCP